MWEEGTTASGLPYVKSPSQEIVKAGIYHPVTAQHFSMQDRSPPLCIICVFLKGIKPSHHLL